MGAVPVKGSQPFPGSRSLALRIKDFHLFTPSQVGENKTGVMPKRFGSPNQALETADQLSIIIGGTVCRLVVPEGFCQQIIGLQKSNSVLLNFKRFVGPGRRDRSVWSVTLPGQDLEIGKAFLPPHACINPGDRQLLTLFDASLERHIIIERAALGRLHFIPAEERE